MSPAGEEHLNHLGQLYINNGYTSYVVKVTNPLHKIYSVNTRGPMMQEDVQHTVNLLNGTCCCCRMQQMKLPCVHVYAVVTHLYGDKWLSQIPNDVRNGIIGEQWLYHNWSQLYKNPSIYGQVISIEDVHAEMPTSITSYPRTTPKKQPGSNTAITSRYTSAGETGRKTYSYSNRRVYAPCHVCGKMLSVKNAIARQMQKGKFFPLHKKSACDKHANAFPADKEEIQAQLSILYSSFHYGNKECDGISIIEDPPVQLYPSAPTEDTTPHYNTTSTK